jgi:hypothetical protein
MYRNLLLSVALVALLAGCTDDEATANEKLTEAVAQVVAAQSAATQTEAHASLVAARDLLAEIRTDLPGTAAALKVVSGETIGTVDLSQLDSLIAAAERGMAPEICASSPTAYCMIIIGLEAEAASRGVSVEDLLQRDGDPQDFFNYFTLLDGGPEAAKALTGQTRTAPDRELFDVIYRLVTLGHEAAAKAWLEATTPAPGSKLTDWPTFLQLAHEGVRGRNLVQTPVTMAAMARLAKSEGALVDQLVTRIGGLEALQIALGDNPMEKLAAWREKGWVQTGSDAEGLIAIALWNAGEKEAARAIFATAEMTQNEFVIESLPTLATPEVQADLLTAALPAATDAQDRARIVMALIALGDEEAAAPALAQLGLETATADQPASDLLLPQPGLLTDHLDRFAETTGIGLGRANAQSVMDALQSLTPERFPMAAWMELQNGWLIGRAIEGETDNLQDAPSYKEERSLRNLMWGMLTAGQAEQATTLFNQLVDTDFSGAQADNGGMLMEAALLAGRFDLATEALGQLTASISHSERALRLRLQHDKAPDEAALFAFLTAWDARNGGRAAALLAADDRFTGAGHPALAARFAFSLDGDRRLEAISQLAFEWPGTRQE